MIKPRRDEPDGPQSLWARLGWMGAIWAGSVGLLALVAWLIRLWLR